MTNSQLLKLLVDRKVADSYQFLDSCQYKLDMAELSYKALKNLITKYQKEEANSINNMFSEAHQNGQGSYTAHCNVVDFFGIEIETTVAIEKLFAEITGLLHNFFDTFAQWINTSLFGERALPIKRVSLNSVISKISEFPEYSGPFITDFLSIATNPKYIYISDLNNTQKHRYQLYVENKFDLLTIQGEVTAPNFEKDGRVHLKTDVDFMCSLEIGIPIFQGIGCIGGKVLAPSRNTDRNFFKIVSFHNDFQSAICRICSSLRNLCTFYSCVTVHELMHKQRFFIMCIE